MSCVSLCTYFLFLAWSCSAGHKSRCNNGLPLSFPSKLQAEWVATVPHSSFCLQVLCMNFLDIFWRSQWPFPRNTSILARLGICSRVSALPFKNRLVSEFNLSLVPSFNGHAVCFPLRLGLYLRCSAKAWHSGHSVGVGLVNSKLWAMKSVAQPRKSEWFNGIKEWPSRLREGLEVMVDGWCRCNFRWKFKTHHPSPFEKSQSLQSNGFDSEENEGMLKTCPLLPNMFR